METVPSDWCVFCSYFFFNLKTWWILFMRKMHDSDSYISEIECPKRTEKSCIALKSCASVANNNIEHIVICPLHATSMPINQDHN